MKPLCLVTILSILIQQSYLKLGTDAFSRDGFVRTEGVQFSLNGYPYYANGFNAYWLMYVASDPSQRPKISAAFQEASRHGLTVARTWAFSDGGYRPLQYSPGSYNEDMFQGLDFAIAEARRHGIKIILSFANNYVSFGGRKQYVDWARSRGRPVSSEDDFFTDALVKDFYKNHIKAVLNRFNTFTKVHYRDDPTIMAWELMNEPRCPSDPTGRTIQAWITEMAAHVKSLDRNHLLEAGLEGFYGQSSPQRKTLNPPGQFGTDFIANNRIPGIDFVTVHSYPDEWFVDSSEQSQMEFLNKWLDAHIQDAQNVLHKPIVLAEFGKSTKKSGFSPAQRDGVFNTVYGKIYESAKGGGAAAGGLFWQLLGNGMDNFQDGYGIILSQSSSTVNVIAQQSRKLTLIRRIFARMINVEKWKRARGYGPVRKGGHKIQNWKN
ncbi:Mannan endo-1,4-beta-mannosidase 7 [Hirschfeldia incana]|nr:Mannan endo-1,4-beta-mannosidase 7 [Hirschfeldia incana]